MIGVQARKPAGSSPTGTCVKFVVLISMLLAFLCGGFVLGRAYEQSLAHPGKQIDAMSLVGLRGLGANASMGYTTAGSSTSAKHAVNAGGAVGPAGSPAGSPAGGSQGGKPSSHPICTNTCAKAKNGVCDDGRGEPKGGANFLYVHCDLGTDCDDCGPWTPDVPVTWGESGEGPIHLLVSKEIEVRVSNTTTPQRYMFAYTNPSFDVDVSSGVASGGLFEPIMSKVFYKIFEQGCKKSDGKKGLFIDVGANFGWYSVMASAMGCRVESFEPVPHFHAFLEYNLHVNGLTPSVTRHRSVVSHESNKDVEMEVPNRGIWGTAGIGGLNIDRNIDAKIEKFKVKSHRLEDLVKEDALLMKADVEGWEWSVIKGAMNLLNKYTVSNIIMEYSPGVPERNFIHEYSIATVQMLMDIINAGYRIGHMSYPWVHSYAVNPMKFGDPVPPMEEVIMGNLRYDMVDVLRIQNGTLGMPMDAELMKYWHGGGAVPEDVNPRSFRSVLGHNTNILCSKDPSTLKLNGVTGLFKLTDPSTKYFVDGDHGQGYRPCRDLIPLVQTRHRCPCTKREVDKCGKLEDLVTKLAAEGKIASSYVLPGVP